MAMMTSVAAMAAELSLSKAGVAALLLPGQLVGAEVELEAVTVKLLLVGLASWVPPSFSSKNVGLLNHRF